MSCQHICCTMIMNCANYFQMMEGGPDLTSDITMEFTLPGGLTSHQVSDNSTGAGTHRRGVDSLKFPMYKQQDNNDSNLLVDLNYPQVKSNKGHSSTEKMLPNKYFQGSAAESHNCDMFSTDDTNMSERIKQYPMSNNKETTNTSPNSMLHMDMLNGTYSS